MEKQTPEWLDKLEYPFEPHFYKINHINLHYVDEGQGEVLLFVHGTPTWSFDFRHQIRELSKAYRCIAIDHIGFGLSDKPENYDYSTENHSLTMEKFIMAMDLKEITLVVHDFGGPIGLNFAIRHPEKIKRLVILNTWLWSSENDLEFRNTKRMMGNPLIKFLYRYFNFSAKYLVGMAYGDKKIPRHIHKHYLKAFPDSKSRNGTIGFLKSLFNDQPWFEKLWSKKEIINKKPTLFIWGMKDKFVSKKYLEKFQAGFPAAKTVKLESAGHFPQDEEAGAVTEAIRDFLRSGD